MRPQGVTHFFVGAAGSYRLLYWSNREPQTFVWEEGLYKRYTAVFPETSSPALVDHNKEGTVADCDTVLSKIDHSSRRQSLADSEQGARARRHEKVRRRTDVTYRSNAAKMSSIASVRKGRTSAVNHTPSVI